MDGSEVDGSEVDGSPTTRASAISSSFCVCRLPRSVTPAKRASNTTSIWSRSRVPQNRPHSSQYPWASIALASAPHRHRTAATGTEGTGVVETTGSTGTTLPLGSISMGTNRVPSSSQNFAPSGAITPHLGQSISKLLGLNFLPLNQCLWTFTVRLIHEGDFFVGCFGEMGAGA